MPEPIPDLRRNQQCHHYQAPTGERCGSPALKGEYYCYHHHIKHAHRSRVLIDPEVTRMELPAIEDRAGIFLALVAVVHRLAENTIDTRRAGHMIQALRSALQALSTPKAPPAPKPPPAPDTHPEAQSETASETPPAPESAAAPESQPDAHSALKPLETLAASGLEPSGLETSDSLAARSPHRAVQAQTAHHDPPTPTQISISKEGLRYFLRSRHCAHCNAELFPAS